MSKVVAGNMTNQCTYLVVGNITGGMVLEMDEREREMSSLLNWSIILQAFGNPFELTPHTIKLQSTNNHLFLFSLLHLWHYLPR